MASAGVLNVNNYAVGNDTDETAGLQAFFNDLTPGGTGLFPSGIYKHDGTVTLPSSVTDLTLVFAGNAWLAPTAGWALKSVSANERLTIHNLQIRINSGSTMTRGLWLAATANWCNLFNPTVWAFATPPANFVGFDVEGAALWVEMHQPRIRKNSGGISGTFAKGIRYAGAANSCRVWGGSINHCDRGVSVEAANSTTIIGTSFESNTDGVHVPSGTAASDTCLTTVALCRSESNTNLVNLAKSAVHANYPELYIGGNQIVSGAELANTNSLRVVGFSTPGDLSATALGRGFRVQEGSNAKMGLATLVAGTVTVSTTAVTANSRIFLTAQSTGGTAGALRVSARTAGTSFTITSTSGTDTSTVAWLIFEDAAAGE